MSKPLIIQDEPTTPELARAFENARRNLEWFDAHVEELEVYKRYRGRYVAAAGGELFVADTPQEIDRLVGEKYPDELAHVQYIQREKLDRIYVFTEGESAELSVLGRDVTNNFSVIYDYPNRSVALLARPHYYEIKSAS